MLYQTRFGAAVSELNLGFNWNANGTLGSQTIARPNGFSATRSYTYDGVNRLKTAAEGSNWNPTYVYDGVVSRAVTGSSSIPVSNYTPQSPDGVTVPFNGNNQWAGAGNPAGYDLAGNTTAVRTQAMTYDAESRMTSWVDSSVTGSTVTLTYDGDGRRVTKTSGGATTTYVYDPAGNLAAEYGGSAPGTKQTLYLTQDHLGSTRLVTTTGGACVGAHDYLPFGEEIAAGWGRSGVPCYGATDTTVKFTGQERDPENGLDNFLARHMDAAIGRFLSPDPAGNFVADLTNPQSWNLYGYALNNPLVFIDPSGLDPCPPGSAADTCVTVTDSPPGVGTITVAPGQCAPVYVDGQANGSYCNSGGSATQVPQGPQPPQPPQPPKPKTVADRFNCAARFGDAHSIASILPFQNTKVGNFVGQFLAGNTFSGLIDIGLNVSGYSAPSGSDLALVALSGAGQGLPPIPEGPGIQTLFVQDAEKIGSHSAGWDGAAGIAVDSMARGVASAGASVLPARAVGAIGRLGFDAANVAAYGQLALDFGTVTYGFFAACGR